MGSRRGFRVVVSFVLVLGVGRNVTGFIYNIFIF